MDSSKKDQNFRILSGTIKHDIVNENYAIRMALNLLKKDLATLKQSQGFSEHQQIVKNIENMLILISDGSGNINKIIGDFWEAVDEAFPKPESEPEPETTNNPLSDEYKPRSGRILLVDDQLLNLSVPSRIFQSLGCEVDLASSGAEALDLVRQKKYALIIMDCRMPMMDGYQTTEQIRKLETPMNSLPVIGLTASPLDEDRKKGIASGMDEYMEKPLKREQIVEILSGHIGIEKK